MALNVQKFRLVEVTILLLALGSVESAPNCAPCPDEADLKACSCGVSYLDCNAIKVSDSSLLTCITDLTNSTPGGYYSILEVGNGDSVELTENFLQGLLFEQVLIDNTKVTGVHPKFLGASRSVTQVLQFGFCQMDEMPMIDGPNLAHLTVREEAGYMPNISLSSTRFELLPQLQTLSLYVKEATVSVDYHAFYGLTLLRSLEFTDCQVELGFGSLSINSKYLEKVEIKSSWNQEKKCDADKFGCGDKRGFVREADTSALSATPGSLNGFPRGSSLIISTYSGRWSPEVFFNILSLGAYISVSDPHDCCQDLRWVRYSAFVRRFSISCWGSDGSVLSLSEVDLDEVECSSSGT